MMATRNENQIELKTYQDVLEELKLSHERHLLLGNGFNLSLGPDTGYKSIFKKMKERYRGYQKIERVFEDECGSNIEKLIEKMTANLDVVLKDRAQRDFLPGYIQNEIKLDFMKAASTIVRGEARKIKVEDEKVFSFLKNFTNYFTLNYDSFLYQLLMKFMKNDDSKLQDDDDAADRQKELDNKVKDAYLYGEVSIKVSDGEQTFKLQRDSKGRFTTEVTRYFLSKGWYRNEIASAINRLWEEIQDKADQEDDLVYDLEVYDGFRDSKRGLRYDSENKKTLYFLHGAFHLYERGNVVYKTTKDEYARLDEKIEQVVHSEEQNIVCVFSHDDKDKLSEIKRTGYLKDAYQKLSELKGALVIVGSSLADNDEHIFEQIRKSRVNSIYIASYDGEKNEHLSKAVKYFREDQKVTLFRRESIFNATGSLF